MPRQSIKRSGMTEETGIDIDQPIEQGWKAGGILVGRAQTFQHCGGRSQVLGVDVLGDVRSQRAVGTVKNDSGLALNQQAQLRELVFQDGAGRD